MLVANVVDSEFAWLNQPLAAHYGVAGWRALSRCAVEVRASVGRLAYAGPMLIGNGTGSAPHPIYRAVWLQEAILGDDVAVARGRFGLVRQRR